MGDSAGAALRRPSPHARPHARPAVLHNATPSASLCTPRPSCREFVVRRLRYRWRHRRHNQFNAAVQVRVTSQHFRRDHSTLAEVIDQFRRVGREWCAGTVCKKRLRSSTSHVGDRLIRRRHRTTITEPGSRLCSCALTLTRGRRRRRRCRVITPCTAAARRGV